MGHFTGFVCKFSMTEKATTSHERAYLALSTVSKREGTMFEMKKNQWNSVVDEATGKKRVDFTKKQEWYG